MKDNGVKRLKLVVVSSLGADLAVYFLKTAKSMQKPPILMVGNSRKLEIHAEAYPFAHFPFFKGHNHMQFQIRDPEDFAAMFRSIIENGKMPELTSMRKE